MRVRGEGEVDSLAARRRALVSQAATLPSLPGCNRMCLQAAAVCLQPATVHASSLQPYASRLQPYMPPGCNPPTSSRLQPCMHTPPGCNRTCAQARLDLLLTLVAPRLWANVVAIAAPLVQAWP